jgi:hypothetical protein
MPPTNCTEQNPFDAESCGGWRLSRFAVCWTQSSILPSTRRKHSVRTGRARASVECEKTAVVRDRCRARGCRKICAPFASLRLSAHQTRRLTNFLAGRAQKRNIIAVCGVGGGVFIFFIFFFHHTQTVRNVFVCSLAVRKAKHAPRSKQAFHPRAQPPASKKVTLTPICTVFRSDFVGGGKSYTHEKVLPKRVKIFGCFLRCSGCIKPSRACHNGEEYAIYPDMKCARVAA